MAYKVADRVKETTVVTGTGPATLLGAVSGYRTFASQLSIGDTCAYAIVNANASEWEVGIGTYSAVNTLTRTTVHASTNSNAAVVFTAGTKDVFLSPTAETVLSDVTSTDGTVTLTKTGSIVDLSVAVAAATTNVIVQVRNNTGATLTKGTVVYINNAIGQIPTVAKALATSDATSAQTLGMVSADINDNANGYVTIIGLINDINTGSYLDGDQLYLSGTTAGTFTKVKPYAPTHLVYVGVVEYAHSVHGKIFVKVQNGYEMDELHNVDAYNPSNGDLLIYNTSTNLWTHSPQSSLTVAPSQVTGTAVITSDSRLSDSRTPTGSAGGVLSGTYPNPSFASTTGSGSVVLSTAPTLTTATFAAGTISASTPNTITQTWNNAAVTFQALVVNATNNASATLSSLIDLQVGGSSKFSVLKDGRVFYGPNVGVIVGSGMQWYGGSNASSFLCEMTTGGFGIGTNSFFGWTSRNSGIYQPVDHTYEYRGGTNPQSLRVYNTYTDASNYERAEITWTSNVCNIGIANAGTGTARRLGIGSGVGVPININSNMELQSGSLVFRWYNGSTIGVGPSFSDIYFSNPNNFVSVRNGTAGQKFGVYNTFTDVNNYERLAATWASNICTIGLEQAGTGLPRTLNVNANALNAPSLPVAATVTAATGNGTTVTYTCASTFSIGQVVSITGLTPTTGASLNLSNQTITGVTATTFTIANATVGTAAATQAGTATIQSAGNSVTITAGNGSGVGAGGNIILQPGAQGTSGGNGTTVIKSSGGSNRIVVNDGATYEFKDTGATTRLTIDCRTNGWNIYNGSSVQMFQISGTPILDMYPTSFNGVMYSYTSLAWAMNTPATFSTDQTDYLLGDNGAICKKIHRLATTNAAGNAIHSFKVYNGSWGGHELTIVNVGAYNLTIKHNSATGTAAWRMFNATGADIILGPNDKLDLMYDNVNNGSGAAGWRAW